MRIVTFLIGLMIGSCASLLWADPTSEELHRQAVRCRQLLMRSVVDFYLPACVDQRHGGYLEELNESGQFVPGNGKFLTLQARQLWLFSVLAAHDIRKDEALVAAKSGFDFIQTKFRDQEHGGYFSRVSDEGRPTDTRKHVYHNAFAIYGLVAYFRATGDQTALRAALDVFDTLENKSYDMEFGGYQEFFHADWRLVTDPSESTYVGAISTKTYNSHLHLLEAFSELYRVAPNSDIARRLGELLTINTVTVRHPEYACNIDGWTRDWKLINKPANLRASYGHDVECVWLVFDAARALRQSVPPLRSWSVSLVENSLKHGFDGDHGGFYYTGPVGEDATDRRKEWWVECEALVSMLEMFSLTGDKRYYEAFEKTLDFVAQHQVDEMKGGWWATTNADGSPHRNKSRSSTWHGGYHNGRALLLSSQLLHKLSEK